MSAVGLAWMGASLVAMGLLALALSRPFVIEKISVFGLEFKFAAPIAYPGDRRVKLLGLILFLLGGAVSAVAGYRTAFPSQWPKSFSKVSTAEIQLAEVDDIMTVAINDHPVEQAKYGATPSWIDIKPFLHKGANKIEVIIQNGQYGGCGGSVALRLNGLENPSFKWAWSRQENQLPGVVCFAQTKTVNLE